MSASFLHALVPCAGVGARAAAGGPKQYALVAGRCVVEHTLAALGRVARFKSIWVVLSADDHEFARRLPDFGGQRLDCGGATRAQTVANGLAAMASAGVAASDWVLVHDAARCLIRPEWVDALIDSCLGEADGGLLALPVADTLKSARDGRVASTIDRRDLWQAQTPQMFRLGPLRKALAQAGDAVTDEASAVEAAGGAPRLVPGSIENFKLTYPGDFQLAERLMKSRG